MNVRLSDEAAKHIENRVGSGLFGSRAQYLTWLLEREAQRERALADLQQLRDQGALADPNPELADFRRRNARRSLSHLD